MESFWQDVRHGARVLGKARSFTAVAIVTLALGVGANTAIFSVVNAVLLKPLPYAEPERLVRVAEQVRAAQPGGGKGGIGPRGSFVTGDTFRAWRESTQTLDGLAAYAPRAYTLTGLGDPIRLHGTSVSASMFSMLGVAPQQGRLFNPGEEKPGADQVALLSDGLWTRRFGRAADIVGKAIVLDDKQYTIVGVLPAGFYFPDRDTEIWSPMTLTDEAQRPGQRVIVAFSAIGRLKSGVAMSQAEAEGAAVAQRVQPPPPPGVRADSLPPVGMHLVPLREEIVANVRPALLVLLAAVGFVLLIACANIANLLLARGAVRQRELAVRTALGAQRGRLLRQLLIESLMLALIGGTVGVLFAYGLQRALPALSPGNIPRIEEATLNARVLAFACGLSIVTGLLFGLAPALQGSRVNVLSTLNEAGIQRMGGFRFLKGNRLRSLLVVAEVALSIVLLAGAGLLVRSFLHLIDTNPGYDPANVITAQISIPATRYGTPAQQRAFYTQLLDRVVGAPGVKAAGTTNLLPLLPGNMILGFGIEGQPQPADPRDFPRASVRIVSAGYAEAMGLRLVAGRFLSPRDTATTTPVVLVTESTARQYFPGGKAVGNRLLMFGPAPIEIAGVVGDVRHSGLDAEPQPEIFIPISQIPDGLPLGRAGGTSLVVRATGDPLALVPFLRQAVIDVDHDVPLDNVMTMEARVSASVAGPRFYALLLGLFAVLALVLAAVGLYGVLSYNVTQRHREIGVRMALGAERRDILGLVVRQGLILAVVGVVIGVAGAYGVTRFLKALLYGITPTDPATYVAICVLLLVVAFVACWLPALRATRVDPMVALRYE
jgi:putative ABC transport system permease protein